MATLVPLILALAALGAAAGVLVARFAARRSVAQPITVELDAERAVVATVLQESGLYPAFAELRPEMFAAQAHGHIWAEIQEQVAASGQELVAADQAALRELSPQVPPALTAQVLGRLGSEELEVAQTLIQGEDRTSGVRDVLTDENPDKETQKSFEKLLRNGELVLAAHQDREGFKGSAPIRETGDPHTPLVREHVPAGRSRTLFSAVLCALGLALVPFLVLERTPIESTPAQLLAGGAVALMLLASAVVALVDWDTLYLDLPVFWISAVGIWGLTTLAQVVDGAPERLLQGLWAILLMLFVVEGLLKVYAKLRGLPMQGGGDTQILFVTAGVPAALSDSVMVGLFGGVVASAVVALVVYGGAWAVGKYEKDQPFAYGPFLALGWVLGWAAAPLLIPGVYV